jgi:hypothetical protein
MQTQLMDLFTIMGSHFQRSISQAMNMAVNVQISDNTGESESESFCVYYYLFLFSGWWFNVECTDVAFNGKYNPLPGYGFRWYSPATLHIVPDRSEMKIRRQ